MNLFVLKIKEYAEWWKAYMTDLSVVVISIAVTFYGENRITQYNERQEDREVMQMILNELQENEEELGNLKRRCTNDILFSSLLRRYLERGDTLTPDTLRLYHRYHYLYPQWIFKRNAFDVMKTSGVMQRMDDKKLLISIFDCYDQIELVREMGIRFKEERFRMIMEYTSVVSDNHEEKVLEQWKQIDSCPPFRNYLSLRFRYSALNVRAFGGRAWAATDSVKRMIKNHYHVEEN